jgi:hypothetical protein
VEDLEAVHKPLPVRRQVPATEPDAPLLNDKKAILAENMEALAVRLCEPGHELFNGGPFITDKAED